MINNLIKKLVVFLLVFIMLLSSCSTTILAVEDVVTSSTEEEISTVSEETSVISDTVSLDISYTVSEDSSTCTVEITSSSKITSIYVSSEEYSADLAEEDYTFTDDTDSWTISSDGLTATKDYTENQDGLAYKIVFEDESYLIEEISVDSIVTSDSFVMVDNDTGEVYLSVSENYLEDEITSENTEETSTSSGDDGIATVSEDDIATAYYSYDYFSGTFTITAISGSLANYGHELHYIGFSGATNTALLFCMQYKVTTKTGSSTIGSNVTFYDAATYDSAKYAGLLNYIYFGYSQYYGCEFAAFYECIWRACATQQFIWEWVYNNVTTAYSYPSRDSWNSTYMSSSLYSTWYNEMISYYGLYYDNPNPSFNGATYSFNAGTTQVLTDTTYGALRYYPAFDVTINGIEFIHERSSDTMTVVIGESASTAYFDSSSYSLFKQPSYQYSLGVDTITSTSGGGTSCYLDFTDGSQDLIYSDYLPAYWFTITITPVYAVAYVAKIDTSSTSVAGAVFGIYSDSSCSTLLQTATSSSSGTVIFDSLIDGRTYYIKEISAPSGYLLSDTVYTVVASVDGTTVTGTNYEPTGEITVYKENTNGDGVKGAVFSITATSDIYNVSGGTLKYSSGDVVATLTTDSNGEATVSDLPLGTYTVTETSVPTGYLLNENSKTITLSYSDQSTSVIYGSATIVNEEPTGEIRIEKTDEDTGNDSRVISGEVFHGDATLEGTVITLYAGEDIYNVEKTVQYFEEDEIIATYTFDEWGYATIDIVTDNATVISTNNGNTLIELVADGDTLTGLPLGSYYAVETTVSEGYMQNTNTYTFDLTYEDMYTDVISLEEVVENTVQKAKFEVIKASSDDNTTEEVIEGAEITAILTKYVTYYGSFEEALKHLDEYADDEYSVFTTDSTGHGVSGYLAYGDYTVNETYTPSNRIETIEEFYVTIDKNGAVISEWIENDLPFKAYIKIYKQDLDSGEEVVYSNTTFKLYKLDEDTNEWEEVGCKLGKTTYYEWTTDEDGIAWTETKLEAGIYKVEEIVLPEGFLELDEELTFEVVTDNETIYWDEDGDAYISVYAINEQPKGELIINKTINLRDDVDISLIDVDYTGIEFTLTAAETIIDYTDGEVIYEEGEVVGVYSLDETGYLHLEDLWMGAYYLQETKTLDGLVIDDTVYDVIFEMEDTVTKVYTIELDIENDTTCLEISKTDVNDNLIDGATLTLYDEDGEEVLSFETSSEDSYSIEGLLVYNTYTVSETVTPEGYVTATDEEVYIENTADIQSLQMKDKRYSISKLNVAGEEVEGATLQVIDEDGNIVDEWVSTDEVHYISGLVEGGTYTLHEEYSPDGYVYSTDYEFTVSYEKVDEHYDLVDETVYVTKTNVDGDETLTGTGLTVYDSEGNVVDTWYVGEQIIELTEEEQAELEENGYLEGTISSDTDSDEETSEETDEDDEITEDAEDDDDVSTTEETSDEDEETSDDEETETEITAVSYVIEAVEDEEYYRLKLVYSDDTIEYYYINSDGTESYHMVRDLVEGETYTLVETYTLDEYVTSLPIEFTVPTDKSDLEITMIDKQYSISKLNVAGEEVEGATLQVIDEDGNIVDEWVSTDEPHYISGLTEGETYTLHEEYAPDGYVYAADYEFTVSEEKVDEHYDLVDETVYVTKTNVDGDETLTGTGLTVYDSEGNVVDTWYVGEQIIELTEEEQAELEENGYLEGTISSDTDSDEETEAEETSDDEETETEITAVSYVIEAVEDEEYYRLKLVYSDDTIEYYYINSDGTESYHMVRDLVEGETYTLVETYTLDEYVTSLPIEFTVPTDKSDLEITMIDKQYSISKLNVAGEEVEGATLQVIDEDGNIVDEWVSTDEPHYISGLTEGETYTLHEEYAPDGYVYAADYEFTVSEEKVDEHYDLVDETVYVTKTNVDGDETLTGTGLTVYDSEGNVIDTWYVGQQIIELTEEEQAELEENGYLELSYVEDTSDEDDDNILDTDEEEAEEETSSDETDEDDDLSTTEETTDEIVEDTEATIVSAVIETVEDEEYYRLKLVYSDDTIEYYYINSDGTESYHMVRDLVEGETYTLVETYTLDGYVTSLPIEFTVPENKEDLEIVMIDEQVLVNKVTSSDEALVGATLAVYNEEGIVVDSWITDGETHYVSGLTEGESYTLVELEAPDGYEVADSIDFVIPTEKQNITITMVDNELEAAAMSKLPQTGF